jgi:CRP/FNR family transcriptional regulator
MATLSEMLSEVPLFQTLDEEERDNLAAGLEAVQYPAGEMIFQTNEPGDALYIIRTGKVELFVKDDTGHRHVLETAIAFMHTWKISNL